MLSIMIAAIFVQAAPASQVTQSTASSDDIVVTAERMRRIRLVTRRDRKTGESRCIVRRSSGRADLDTAMCTETLACAAKATDAGSMTSCLELRMSAISSAPAKAPVPRG